MSVIESEIPRQAFELVRDRIGAIITDEMANQFALTGNPDYDIDVYLERIIRVDKTEPPLVNVSLGRGEYNGQTVIQADGTYKYHIDGYVQAKSRAGQPGDTLAMVKLQRLLGMVRAIIQDHRYIRLGFAPPFVMSRQIETLGVMELPDRDEDATSTVMGRLVLSVKVPETTELLDPLALDNTYTVMKISNTEKGYKFDKP